MVRIHSQGSQRVERHEDTSLATLEDFQGAASATRGRKQRQRDWQAQQATGSELLAVGDFAWGDRVLAHSYLVGQAAAGAGRLETYGRWFAGEVSCQLPVFERDQTFAIGWEQLFVEVAEARALGLAVKPVILGPLSYLWLGRCLDPQGERLDLLEALLPVYGEIFARLAAQGVEWVQIDEPLLALELPLAWRTACERAYNLLQREPLKKLLAVTHGELTENLGLAAGLPVDGLHIDWPRTVQTQQSLLDRLPAYKTLSLGLIAEDDAESGAGERRLQFARQAGERLKDRLWLASAIPPRDADENRVAAANSEFARLVRAAREAAEAKPVVATERPWSAIEAALAKLGATPSRLVSS